MSKKSSKPTQAAALSYVRPKKLRTSIPLSTQLYQAEIENAGIPLAWHNYKSALPKNAMQHLQKDRTLHERRNPRRQQTSSPQQQEYSDPRRRVRHIQNDNPQEVSTEESVDAGRLGQQT